MTKPNAIDRGKFSPEVEAKDLVEGDWETLPQLEAHAAEIIGIAFDTGFVAGKESETKPAEPEPLPAAATKGKGKR